MKESMLKSVRIEDGIGNSSKGYVNNDPEAANFMVKHALNFGPKKSGRLHKWSQGHCGNTV